MADRNRSRLRYPQACRLIHWILALMPSARAFVTFVRTALITPSQWRLIIRATFLIGSNRLRIAHPYQRLHMRTAQPRDRSCHSRIANALIAHARATRNALVRSGVNARRCRGVRFAGRVNHRSRVFASRSSPCCRTARCSDRRT